MSMSSQLLGLTDMEDGTSAGYIFRVCSRSMRNSTFVPIRRALGRASCNIARISLVRLLWAPTDHLAADILTKNLGRAKFKRFQEFVLGLPAGAGVRTLLARIIRCWG